MQAEMRNVNHIPLFPIVYVPKPNILNASNDFELLSDAYKLSSGHVQTRVYK